MRDIDWSAIPFDDLPPWHLDWDVDQRENATYPATTSITAMRPLLLCWYWQKLTVGMVQGWQGNNRQASQAIKKHG
ncbi:TPA: hypothetical protein JLK88_001747 [Escherichia coli]|nr:hypothetical protein [Escherichia coli]